MPGAMTMDSLSGCAGGSQGTASGVSPCLLPYWEQDLVLVTTYARLSWLNSVPVSHLLIRNTALHDSVWLSMESNSNSGPHALPTEPSPIPLNFHFPLQPSSSGCIRSLAIDSLLHTLETPRICITAEN